MLSNLEIEEFYEDGYLILYDLFNSEEINEVSNAFTDIANISKKIKSTSNFKDAYFVLGENHSEKSPQIRRINWCNSLSESIDKISQDPKLLKPISQLMGSPSFNQIICQAHYKLPGDGVSYPWHQDTQHDKGKWVDKNSKGSFVLAMIAIDDCTLSNGAVKILSGSSKLGTLNIEKEDPSNNQKIQSLLSQYPIVDLVMPSGSVAFIGPYTIHSSEANESNIARRMLMSGYSYPGASPKASNGQGVGRLLKAEA